MNMENIKQRQKNFNHFFISLMLEVFLKRHSEMYLKFMLFYIFSFRKLSKCHLFIVMIQLYLYNLCNQHIQTSEAICLFYFILLFFTSSPEDKPIDFRERKRKERERKKNMNVREKCQLVASCTFPNWGCNLKPRYVP